MHLSTFLPSPTMVTPAALWMAPTSPRTLEVKRPVWVRWIHARSAYMIARNIFSRSSAVMRWPMYSSLTEEMYSAPAFMQMMTMTAIGR